MIRNPVKRRDKMPRLSILALALAVVLAGAAAPALAGSIGRVGTDGAPELQIPVGPRGTALGGAVVGDATGAEAMFWNPAGLATLDHTEALFSHTQFFADMKLNYVAVGTKMGGFGTLGLAVKVLSIGDVIVTTEAAPDGTGEIAQPTFTVLGATWARQFTDRVLFGLTANLVNEHVISETATGVAFDFGFQYLTGWRGLRLGAVMKNFGPTMTFGGTGGEVGFVPPGSDPSSSTRIFNTESAAFDLPSYFTLAASYDLFASPAYKVTALGAFQNNNYSGDAIRGGLELGYREMFALRGSYFGTFTGAVNQTTGDESQAFVGGDNLYTGIAIGAGAKVRTGETARLGVDFTWRPVRQGLFDDIYDVGLKFSF